MDVLRVRASLARRMARIGGWLAIAVVAVAGCGESSSGAERSALGGALDYVSNSATAYVVVDTDFDGEAWTRADTLGDGSERSRAVEQRILTALTDGDGGLSFADDVAPWIGDSAGVAQYSGPWDRLVWADVADRRAAETFVDKLGTKAGSSGGFTLYEPNHADGGAWHALSDTLLLSTSTKDGIEDALDAASEGSIADDDGIERVVGELDDDALVAVVVNGHGVRLSVGGGDDSLVVSALRQAGIYNEFQGMSLGITAEERGFRATGFVGFGDEVLSGTARRKFTPTLVDDMPASTAFAATGRNLGGIVKSVIDDASDAGKDTAIAIAQMEGLLGADADEIGEALHGQVALGVFGAPGKPRFALVSESGDEALASDLVDGIAGFARLGAGAAVADFSRGGADGKRVDLRGVRVVGAVMDGAVFVTNDERLPTSFGSGPTLGSAKSYVDALDKSGVPDTVGGLMYVDFDNIATVDNLVEVVLTDAGIALPYMQMRRFSGLDSLVAWCTMGDDSVSFEAFASVDEDSRGGTDDGN